MSEAATDGPAAAPAAATGRIAAPDGALPAVPVPVAELYAIASEYERAGRLDDARRMLDRVLARAPDIAEALHLAGIVAFRQGRRADALHLMRRSLARDLPDPVRWRNAGEVLRVVGLLDEALEAGQRALALAPDDPLTLTNLALIHAARLELDAAERCARRALALDPGSAGAHVALAEILLSRCDFARGWEEYEWRYRLPGAAVNLPPGARRQWDGAPLAAGRLLVVADQGFGDVIQFARYLPWVRTRCPMPLVACATEMRPVLAQLGAPVTHQRWDSLPTWDQFIPLSGLPRLAQTRLDTIPAAIPYLRADPARAARWRGRLAALLPAGFRRVGLVWAGRPTHPNDGRRSAPLQALAPLFELDRTAFVALQQGERQAEVAGYFGAAPLVGLGPELADWEDTMAVLAGLDAVVAVDTAVAHLAGAMGRRVHLLLPHAAEWRWLLGRDDSPWYPDMRLHRQATPGGWDTAAAGAAAALLLPRAGVTK